jgi:putative toxin-antitoxin system antitoxin component (TIGR02293 family)
MTLSEALHTEAVDDSEAGLGQAGRIATILHLPKPAEKTDLDIDEAIRDGVPLKAYEALLASISGSDSSWVPKIISASTIDRAKKEARHRLKPEASGQVYQFARVWDAARLVFGRNTDSLHRFFSTPNAVLKGRKPVDVALSSPAGADAVLRILNEARAGVAA